ncbi:MAG: hypothetical protein AAF682_21550 [Planctomycetota bacterium]
MGVNDSICVTQTDAQGAYVVEGVPKAPIRIRAGLEGVDHSQPELSMLRRLPRPVTVDLSVGGTTIELPPILAERNPAYVLVGQIDLDPTWAARQAVALTDVRVTIEADGGRHELKVERLGGFRWSAHPPPANATLLLSVPETHVEATRLLETAPRTYQRLTVPLP